MTSSNVNAVRRMNLTDPLLLHLIRPHHLAHLRHAGQTAQRYLEEMFLFLVNVTWAVDVVPSA